MAEDDTRLSVGQMMDVKETGWTAPTYSTSYNGKIKRGFDLVLRQEFLQAQTAEVEKSIEVIEANANLSDSEKMFQMQMALNTWSAITNLRTNMLKTVADSLKTIVRNVA